MDQHWLTIIIVLLIIAIIIDGVRRMRKARRDSIKMALKPTKKVVTEYEVDSGTNYGSEFPNGGARVSDNQIDPNRISQVRNKYNFGSDMSAWRTKVAEKIAEHTDKKSSKEDNNDASSSRIEPSLDEIDPLLDQFEETSELTDSELEVDYSSEYDESLSDELETAEIALEDNPITAEMSQAKEQSTKQKAAIEKNTNTDNKEPIQTSLNLEDSVPMLMDSVGEEDKNTSSVDEKGNMPEPEKIVSVATQIEPIMEEQERTLEARSANKPRYESKYTDHKDHQSDSNQQSSHQVEPPKEVLVIHIRAAENEYFYGSDLLDLILEHGMRFGDMNIFHRHASEEGEGPILFSMANMVKPGNFDLRTFEDFSTVGLSFFLGLPVASGSNMEAFDAMLVTAKDIASKLQGELKDENRSVLTKQTIEHYRERIRDFARREQLEKNKP